MNEEQLLETIKELEEMIETLKEEKEDLIDAMADIQKITGKFY